VPRFTAECDGTNSLITEIEVLGGIAILPSISATALGSRLKLRPISPSPAPLQVGYCVTAKENLSPAGENFITSLKKIAAQKS
jgi:DNA-binding transcriptional LysR family regulator